MDSTKYETCANMAFIGSVQTINERHVNFLKRYNRIYRTKYETCVNMTVISSVQTINERRDNF